MNVIDDKYKVATNIVPVDHHKKVVHILAMDGGGFRGIIEARILEYIARELEGDDLAMHFDIIAGTSIGGVLAAYLAAPNENGLQKHPTQGIVQTLIDSGKTTFQPSIKHWFSTGFGLFGSLFKANQKNLKVSYGKAMMSECRTNVLFPTYDILNDEPYIFKSAYAKQSGEHHDYPLQKVIQGVTAIPVVFEPVEVVNRTGKRRVVADGGLTTNNPAMLAMLHAKELYPNATEFHVISLGSGEKIFSQDKHQAGVVHWAGTIGNAIVEGNGLATDNEMQEMFKSFQIDNKYAKSSYCRLQPTIHQKHENPLDSSDKQVKALINYADKLIAENEQELKDLLNGYNARFATKQKNTSFLNKMLG